MKTYLGLALLFVALGFSGIGQAFATGSFGITTNCYDLTYPVNCGPVTVTVTSVNGFSGTVNLSTSVNPSCGYNCLNATLSPTSVSVSSGGSATSKVSFSIVCHTDLYHPHCLWDVTITGTSSGLQNSTDVFVCIGRICPV